MRLEFGYGETTQCVDLPDANLAGVLLPNRVDVSLRGSAEVERSLRFPIGAPSLGEVVKPGEKIAIVTSDVTRPMPSAKVLPPVLRELGRAGVRSEDVCVVFALGSHRRHSEEEMRRLVGDDIFGAVRCVDGDPADCVRLGTTSFGTPVDVTRVVAEADRRIALGNIEFHYFAGYSGGAKAIMPGVSTREAIQANHSRMVDSRAAAGRLDDNPLRIDIEEAVRFCPIDFIVNVVLDEHKEIIRSVAGHHVKAHREGCRFLDALYCSEIRERADIVIASQGGAPKDLNLYQTQKALDNAKHAVRKGGIVILAGCCREGMGEDVFEQWMLDAESPSELIRRVESDFQLGGHKAAAIAMVLRDSDIYLVSEMPPDFVKSIFMQPFATVEDALESAFKRLGRDSKVLAMPFAGSTLPVLR